MEIRSVLVAVSNIKNVEDLTHFACRIAKEEKAKLYGLYVNEVPHTLPLDANLPEELEKGERVLSKLEEIAEDLYAMKVATEMFQARRAGPAILEMAIESKADLLVIGATLRASVSERLFGSTVEYLLKKAECRVLVVRPSRDELRERSRE